MKKRKYRCLGCGPNRPCIIETNQVDCAYDDMVVDDLVCVIDNSNQSYSWEELTDNE